MIIPIMMAPSPEGNAKLPPSLAKISHDEVVLIELQGLLNVECKDAADRNGQLIGNLRIDETGV
jgi:chromosome transmission fidelity protein 8